MDDRWLDRIVAMCGGAAALGAGQALYVGHLIYGIIGIVLTLIVLWTCKPRAIPQSQLQNAIQFVYQHELLERQTGKTRYPSE